MELIPTVLKDICILLNEDIFQYLIGMLITYFGAMFICCFIPSAKGRR